MLEVRRAIRREHIFRDRTNPLEIYDDLELIERFRYNETSVFALAHAYIVPFFLYFFNVSFYGIPGIYYVCNFLLFLSPEVIDEENFAFKITFLFSYSSNNTAFSLSVQFGFCLDIFYFQQSRIVTFKHTRP